MPFGLTPEVLLSALPTAAIALLLLNRFVDLAKASKYGPAIAAAFEALRDGEITKDEFDNIMTKLG